MAKLTKKQKLARKAKKAFRVESLDITRILCASLPLHKRPVLDLIKEG